MRLPPEIRDIIVDYLKDDDSALRASSVVCRAWLPRARYHIFRRVRIEPGRRAHAFRALMDHTPEIGHYIQDVEICGAVHEVSVDLRWPTLRIGGHSPRPASPTRASEANSWSWLERALPDVPKTLDRTACLRLSKVTISKELVQVLQPHFGKIDTLILSKCCAESFTEFCEIPRALTHIENLHILEAQWLRSGLPPSSMVPSHRPTLKSLVLSDKADAVIVANWLVSQRRCSAMTELSCHISSSASAVAIRDLLRAVGPSLQFLGVGFSNVRDPSVLLQTADFNLVQCTGLQVLHIYCVDATRFYSMPSLSWIVILLSKANSHHLSELRFVIRSEDVSALNLEGLAVILSNTRYKSLKRLVFNLTTRWDTLQSVEKRIVTRVASLLPKALDVCVMPHQRCSSRE